MREPRVLVVDDSQAMVETLKNYLGDHHCQVETATSGEAALRQFQVAPPDVVLTDLRMKGFDGLDLLGEILKRDPHFPVVIMTAFGNVESAVEAIQRGAYHYVTKPFQLASVRILLQRAARDRLTGEENTQLRAMREERFAPQGLLGRSAAMREVRTLIARIANADCPVLIEGETGTGKDSVGRAIHVESDRRNASFVSVDCGSGPEELLDSQLFGHSRGAFRGATHVQHDLFSDASGGTLFLDNVGDLPTTLQGKVLRLLDTVEPRPLGSETAGRTDVRFIAATRHNLEALVREGKFREDLYFRLNVVAIRMPALRDRRDDIGLLLEHFLANLGATAGPGPTPTFTGEALRLLEAHSWPGNVRELENLVQRLVVIVPGPIIDADLVRSAVKLTSPGDPIQSLVVANVPLDVLERRYIEAVLQHTEGNKVKAAAILGIDLSTLYRRNKQRR